MSKIEEAYTYCFIRYDISLAQQLVQGIHAGIEAGKAFTEIPHYNLIMIGIQDEYEIFEVEQLLAENGIRFRTFFEPDNNMGHSAICTEALTDRKKRKALAHYSLWVPKPLD